MKKRKYHHEPTGNAAKDHWLHLYSKLRNAEKCYSVYPNGNNWDVLDLAKKKMVEFCGRCVFRRSVYDPIELKVHRKLEDYFYWKKKEEEAKARRVKMWDAGEWIDYLGEKNYENPNYLKRAGISGPLP
jgi:hypothetical protein